MFREHDQNRRTPIIDNDQTNGWMEEASIEHVHLIITFLKSYYDESFNISATCALSYKRLGINGHV